MRWWIAVVLAGCATEILDGDTADLAPVVDLTQPSVDLTRFVSCGDILECTFGCSQLSAGCFQMCATGATGDAQARAAMIYTCGVANCAGAVDGGVAALASCLQMKCMACLCLGSCTQ